ncbi:MAG: hypothetical protein KHX03_05465 [Clostridium sp.]|nr:hypothetical protein [Clostridium sp.]
MKTILVDLDGVINDYCGNYIKDFIPPLRKDAREFLELLSKSFKVVIFSTRDEALVKDWLKKNNLLLYISSVTNVKIPAFVQIDDRCINFKGNYADAIENIMNFKPFWASSNSKEQE